jgi:4-amino-4-deoxy-L-arabinose transferase-like glycosyltransferase
LLFFILLLSLGLRLWGSGFGLPAYTRYHPDEHALVERAAAILWTGDWNLHRFNYPPFYAYIQALTYAAYFLWGAAQGLWSQVPPFTIPQYYHVGRVLTAFFGTFTVMIVYLTGRLMLRQRASLLAAALLGGSYLHIIHSHYATFDVMVGFLAAATLLFSELMRTRVETRWYFLAGLFAGLAGATKYNGATVIVIPLIAYLLARSQNGWRFFLIVGGFLLGFFGGNPFALHSFNEFLNGLATVLHHYGTEQPGFEGEGNWRWYVRVFFTSADALSTALGALGLIGFLWRDRKKGLMLFIFPVVYFVLVSRFTVRFERNMVPILPFLALAGGWLLDAAADKLTRHQTRRRLSHIVVTLGVILVLVMPLTAATLFDITLSGKDHRETAGEWLEENIEWSTKIAIEHYSIPFDHTEYWVEDLLRISDHDLAWYQSEGFDLLIISDGVWELLLQQPETYPEKTRVYNQLTDNSKLIAEFVPDPANIVVAGYPTVAVYHFAPVRIYELPK